MHVLLSSGLMCLGLWSVPGAAVLQLTVPNSANLDQGIATIWQCDSNDPQSFALYADRLSPSSDRYILSSSYRRNSLSGVFDYSSSTLLPGTYQVVAFDGSKQLATSNQFNLVDPNAASATQSEVTSSASTSDSTSLSSSTDKTHSVNSSSSLGQTSTEPDSQTSNNSGTSSFLPASATVSSQAPSSQRFSSQTSSPSDASTSGSSSKSQTSTIMGAIIGATLGLVLLAIAVIFVLRRHRRKKNVMTHEEAFPYPTHQIDENLKLHVSEKKGNLGRPGRARETDEDRSEESSAFRRALAEIEQQRIEIALLRGEGRSDLALLDEAPPDYSSHYA